MNVLDGTVIGQCMARQRHHEFIQVMAAVPVAGAVELCGK